MNLIRPSIFSGSSNITAVFTESNRSLNFSGDTVDGLDFGINTSTHNSIIENNYLQLLGSLDLSIDSLALANQVHGSNIEIIDKGGVYPNTDGLITKTIGLSLGIQVADCAAVLIADDENQVIGAFHAGWRGALAQIIPKGLEEMQSVGGEVKNFKAYISPCISEKMFEVGEEVANQFPDFFVDRANYFKPHVDLKGFLTHQMIDSGMVPKQIEASTECTMQDDRFFSYRRESEKAGRMVGLINLNHN